MSELGIREILKLLPHRQPFLLIDRVIELVPSKSIVAIKNVTYNEPFFAGHFPHLPVMPGVLILEALAQAAGVLALNSPEIDLEGKEHLFAGIDKARFKRMVVPGDQLRLEIETDKVRSSVITVHARALVDGEIACVAKMMSGITVVK